MNTIQIIPENNCTGCMMCGDICPREAIRYQIKQGFWYPVVDKNKCIDCGICLKKCQALKESSLIKEEPLKCYGAKSKNENIRYNSTSGGFFSELATYWYENSGYCVGAIYNTNNKIVHTLEECNDGISRMRQSKYAQSDIQGVYKIVKERLMNGKKILFCGTSCQVEALYAFLGKEYENLITIDFVCCGICSPVVYRKYLDELEKKYHSKIRKVWFKNKKFGWRSVGVKIEFENGKEYIRPGTRDPFMTCFVKDALSMRESCFSCKYRKTPHRSDFTLADFWGIENVRPEIDDDKGISAVMVNSEKGKALFDLIKDNLDYFETSINDIARGNFTVYSAKVPNTLRKEFLDVVDKKGFSAAVKKYSSYSGFNKFKIDAGFYKKNILERIRGR